MNLIKSTGTFGFFTIISRLLGYLRDMLVAVFLGTSQFADVFFVAFRIPNTFRRLFSEGTFNAAFVPIYSSEMTKGKIKSNSFANSVFNLLFLSLLALVLIVQLFMPFFVSLIAPGFVSDIYKINLATDLTRITFPFVMLVSIASFFSAILNSNNRFAESAAAPIILNIILILILVFSRSINDQLVYILSYGVTIAGLIQLFFLYFFVKKYLRLKIEFKIYKNKKVKVFFQKLLPSIFSSGVAQINILVGTIIASFQASAVSYLYYADRIYQINLAIAGIAIGVVILPQLSKHISNKNQKKIDLIQNKSLELSLFLSLPASFALIIAPEEIISALFGYGQFDKDSVVNSAKALFYFSFGLPAFAMIKVFSNFFFANQDTKVPFYISLVSVILNILISVYFFKSVGFIIIPIATTISSWFNLIVMFIVLKNRKLFTFNDIFISRLFKIIFSSILMGLFFNQLIVFFDEQISFENKFKSIYLVLSVLLGLCFYIVISYLIKAFKLEDIKLKY
ncbi:murein biosynthesis integral membrane protein MurJ [Candidatus Pelagibacter sp.]|nr:murein biosynthesis integral membrane protein MurJ [Candidatus Pelagibacter sp.]